ncbi:MAG: aminodeoxychorismate synthase, component I, partial [Candidatus Electrothrix sp. AUS1_2]|nr:aminodeoxychorismate synthase, component I [Candidatus Electrothrix sp. AUS1_2]
MKPLDDSTIRRLTSRLEQEDDFVFLESSRLSEENHRSFLFRNPLTHLCCRPGDSVTEFLEQADQARVQGRYLAGWLTYEFGYLLEPGLRRFLREPSAEDTPLAMLGVYVAPLIYDHASGEFSHDCHETDETGWPLRSCGEEKDEKEESCACAELATTVTRREYIRAVRAIQDYI